MNQLCPLSELPPEWCAHCRSDVLDPDSRFSAEDSDAIPQIEDSPRCLPGRFMRSGGKFCAVCDTYIGSWEPAYSDGVGGVCCDRCFA